MKITNAQLNKDRKIEFGDINIFVGSNGTGKTTLLREIYSVATGVTTRSLWVESVDIDAIGQPEATIIKRFLKDDGEGWIIEYHRDDTGQIGNGGDARCLADSHDALLAIGLGNATNVQKELARTNFSFRKNLIGYESTDKRLSILNSVKITNPLNVTDSYNWIDNSPAFKTEIDERFHLLFGQHFIILSHLRDNMHMGVSEELCPADLTVELQEKWRKDNHIPITESGDGMRAAIKLFFSLYDRDLKIIFIDEPEVFIYPAQRRKIAEEIKRLSAEQDKQTFLVTHDSTTLSGLVDKINVDENVKIFYLKDKGEIVDVPFTQAGTAVTPATKQAKYLEALFHRATIFVEGNNDRYLYEETMKSLYESEPSMQDTLFVDTAGADRAIEVARLVKDSKIISAFIFDLDVLKEETKKLDKVISVYKTLGGSLDLVGKSDEDKIKALKDVGIFIVPIGNLEKWCGKSDSFPYSETKALIEDSSKNGFNLFTKKIIDYLNKLVV